MSATTTVANIEAATSEMRPGLEIDTGRLGEYLGTHVAGYAGPLSIRQFKGGQSNPTYLLSTPSRRYVLRRKPPGQLLASAHAVDREYKVITALGRHTDVPVPKTYALCTDEAVIGTWFYVMDHVEGRIFWDKGVMEAPHQPVGPSLGVMAFLNRAFCVIPGHWSGWHFATFPTISEIVFVDSGRTRALVRVTVGYAGGDVLLEKQDGVWRATKLNQTWVT